jgi:small subunit ribosomal protein S17
MKKEQPVEKKAPAKKAAAPKSEVPATQAATAPSAGDRGLKKVRQGTVVSDKMSKTVVVAVTTTVKHARYGKFLKKTHRYFAHDEREECNVGDIVNIIESRPLSRNKRWRVQNIVGKAA